MVKPQKINGYFAWLDIIGFKEVAKRQVGFSIDLNLLINMFQHATAHGNFIEKTGEKNTLITDLSKKKVRAAIMSDTLILYTISTTKEALKDLLFAVWWLLPCGYIGNEDLALRGAITKGEIEIISTSTPFFDNIFIIQGKASIQAVELESKMGAGICILSEDVCNDIGDNVSYFNTRVTNREGIFNPIIKWPIPLQTIGDFFVQNSIVINWPMSPISIQDYLPKFERMIKATDAKTKQYKIAHNTKEFYNSIMEQREPKYIL